MSNNFEFIDDVEEQYEELNPDEIRDDDIIFVEDEETNENAYNDGMCDEIEFEDDDDYYE